MSTAKKKGGGRKQQFFMQYGDHKSYPVDEQDAYWNMDGRHSFKRRKKWIKHSDKVSVLCLKDDCDQSVWDRRQLYNHWLANHHNKHHDGEDPEWVVASHFTVNRYEVPDEKKGDGSMKRVDEYDTEYRLVSLSSPLRQIPPSLVNIYFCIYFINI